MFLIPGSFLDCTIFSFPPFLLSRQETVVSFRTVFLFSLFGYRPFYFYVRQLASVLTEVPTLWVGPLREASSRFLHFPSYWWLPLPVHFYFPPRGLYTCWLSLVISFPRSGSLTDLLPFSVPRACRCGCESLSCPLRCRVTSPPGCLQSFVPCYPPPFPCSACGLPYTPP